MGTQGTGVRHQPEKRRQLWGEVRAEGDCCMGTEVTSTEGWRGACCSRAGGTRVRNSEAASPAGHPAGGPPARARPCPRRAAGRPTGKCISAAQATQPGVLRGWSLTLLGKRSPESHLSITEHRADSCQWLSGANVPFPSSPSASQDPGPGRADPKSRSWERQNNARQ